MNVAEAVMSVKRQITATVRQSRQLLWYWYNVRVDYDEELVVGCVPRFKLTLKPVSLPLL